MRRSLCILAAAAAAAADAAAAVAAYPASLLPRVSLVRARAHTPLLLSFLPLSRARDYAYWRRRPSTFARE